MSGVRMKRMANNANGADGVQTAVFRKGRARLKIMQAAAH